MQGNGHMQLPPAPDGGWGFVVLVGAVLTNIVQSGYKQCIGVFFVEWQNVFGVGAQAVGYVGIILGFISPLMGLPAGGLSKTIGCRPVIVIGGVSLSVALLLSAFCTKLWHLYLTTLLAAVGNGFACQPVLVVIGHYFQKYLGIANGIALSGAGLGVVLAAPTLQFLIDQFGWQRSYFIISALSSSIVLFGLLFRPSDRELYLLKHKLTHKPYLDSIAVKEDLLNVEEGHDFNIRPKRSLCTPCYYYFRRVLNFLGFSLIWKYPLIIFLFLAFGLLGCGYYASVVFFIPKAVFDSNIERQTAVWLVSIIGIGSTIVRASHGVLLHFKLIGPMPLFIISALTCSISDLMIPWATSFLSLSVCAFFLGLGSGCATSVAIMCIREVIHPSHVSNAWGIAMMFFGFGNLFGVYVMAYLYDLTSNYNISFYVAGGVLTLAAMSMAIEYYLHHIRGMGKNSYKNDEIQETEDNNVGLNSTIKINNADNFLSDNSEATNKGSTPNETNPLTYDVEIEGK